ncbi:MAG: S24 family peptidase [Planctomycetota bacterium]
MPPAPTDSADPPPCLGALLRNGRKARGLTLAALGDEVGATPGYLSMIENGRVENPPSAALLQRLEAALELRETPLQRAAAWAATPPTVRAEIARLADEAERGRKLAAWLRSQTEASPSTTRTPAPPSKPKARSSQRKQVVGKDLDALYRSGQLSKRINAVLRDPKTESQPKTPDAALAPGVESPAAPPVPGGAPGRSPASPPRGNVSSQKVPPSRRMPPPGLRHTPRIPMINRVAAGDPSSFTDLGFPAGIADDYVAVPGLTDPDAFATLIDGASMHPDYREGDIVVFSPLADVTDGCDAFVRLEPEQDVTFKRVYFDEAAGTVRLQPLNPDFAPRTVPRDQVAGCFRAVWRFAKL